MVLIVDREYLSLQVENHQPDLKGNKVFFSDTQIKQTRITASTILQIAAK